MFYTSLSPCSDTGQAGKAHGNKTVQENCREGAALFCVLKLAASQLPKCKRGEERARARAEGAHLGDSRGVYQKETKMSGVTGEGENSEERGVFSIT